MNWKRYCSILFSDLFLATLFLYTAILFAELLEKGIVTRFINTTVLMLVIAVSGVGMLSFPPHSHSNPRLITHGISAAIGAYVGLLVYLQTAPFAPWAYLFAVIAGSSVFMCGFFVSKPLTSNL